MIQQPCNIQVWVVCLPLPTSLLLLLLFFPSPSPCHRLSQSSLFLYFSSCFPLLSFSQPLQFLLCNHHTYLPQSKSLPGYISISFAGQMAIILLLQPYPRCTPSIHVYNMHLFTSLFIFLFTSHFVVIVLSRCNVCLELFCVQLCWMMKMCWVLSWRFVYKRRTINGRCRY